MGETESSHPENAKSDKYRLLKDIFPSRALEMTPFDRALAEKSLSEADPTRAERK